MGYRWKGCSAAFMRVPGAWDLRSAGEPPMHVKRREVSETTRTLSAHPAQSLWSMRDTETLYRWKRPGGVGEEDLACAQPLSRPTRHGSYPSGRRGKTGEGILSDMGGMTRMNERVSSLDDAPGARRCFTR